MRHILNIAHRGFTKRFPGNTLEAFRAAIEIRVDGIECDVQETADHRFVAFHDSHLFGTNISRLSLTQIENEKLQGKFKIPTLEETLDLCRGRIKLVVELKQIQSLDILFMLLKSRAELDDIIVASFKQGLLVKLSNLAPETQRAIITERTVMDPIRITGSAKSRALIVKYPYVTTDLVRKAHSHNISLFVWGCSSLMDIRNTLKLDINGIISDFPEVVLNELHAIS